MPTWTFYPTDGAEYDGPDKNYSYEQHTGNGNQFLQNDGGDGDHSLMMFNSNSIRSALQGYNITSITLSFNIGYLTGGGPYKLYWGTHNYTSVPTTNLDPSRLNTGRTIYAASAVGQVNGFTLPTAIGSELRDGVSTGLVLGSTLVNETAVNSVGVRAQDDANKPFLTITGTIANTAPNAPTLNTPAAGAVVDGTAPLNFGWTHSDPQGDPMAAWHFRRNKGGGVYDYWDGSNFVSSDTRLTTSTVTLTNGIMTIPGGKWANGNGYSWSVCTEDPSGLVGPYAADRVLYTSTPSTATATGPTNGSTITSSRPTITWTYSDPDGQPQYGWQALVVSSAVYSDPGFNPDTTTKTAWTGSGTGTATSTTINADLVNHTTYRAYVKTSSTPNASAGVQWSAWSYTQFSVVIPPYAPTVVSPQNGSTADLGTTGFTLDWNDTFFSNVGSQTAFAIRRLETGSGAVTGYAWWNGTWVSSETFLSGSASQYTFRAGEVPNGLTYTFAVAIRDDYNQTSPYSSGSAVTAASVPQVTIIAPESATVTSRPTVTWSVYQAQNNAQQTYQVKVINTANIPGGAGGVGTFDPTTVTAAWDSGEVTDAMARNIGVGVDLVNATDYFAFVRVKAGGLYSSWTYSEFNIVLVPPGTPAVTTVSQADVGAITVTFQGRDNMLTDAAARCASGWMPMDTVGNCSVSQGVFYGSSQSHLMVQVTSTNPGSMMAHTMDTYPVKAGYTYSGAITMVAPVGTSPVVCYTVLHWLDSTGAIISSQYGQSYADQSAVRSLATGVAPAGAVKARIGAQYENVQTSGAVHTFFDPVLRPGLGGEWAPGGLLGSTTATFAEVTSGRSLRFARNVPIPVDTQQVTVTDEEAPIGATVQYGVTTRAVYPNAVLTSAQALSAPTSWTSGYLWLSNPLVPGSSYLFNPQKLGDIVRPVRQGKFQLINRPDTLFVNNVRGLREGSFTIVTYSAAERQAFANLIANYDTLLLRYPPDQGDTVGDSLYFVPSSDAPENRPIDNRTSHRAITMSFVEQLMPTGNCDYE